MKLGYLLLKFAGFAVLLFVFWIYILESGYYRLLGHIAQLTPFSYGDIDYLTQKGGEIVFRVFAIKSDLGIEVRSITANLVLFWALILATPFKFLINRLYALIGGTILLFGLHILAIYFIIRLYVQQTVLLEGIKIFIDGVLLGLVPLLLWFLFMDKRVREKLLTF